MFLRLTRLSQRCKDPRIETQIGILAGVKSHAQVRTITINKGQPVRLIKQEIVSKDSSCLRLRPGQLKDAGEEAHVDPL